MRSRLTLILAVAIVALAALAWTQRASIAMRVMGRAVAANLAIDRVAALPDGLHVAVCGAGSPLPDPDRSGPCLAIIAGHQVVVVDAGTNGARNLQRMGFGGGQVAALFLTHFHSDHIDGMGEMAMQRWVGAAHTEPLPVVGPTGVDEVVAGFNLAYRQDFGYRTAHHGEAVAPPSGAGSRAQPFAPPASGEAVEVWRRDGLVVKAFAVGHEPIHPAVGYRFEYGGRSVVVSGDTRKVPEMVTAARDADLLAHEALAPHLVELLHQGARAAGNANLAKITHDILDYHTSPVEAAEVARDAGVDALLLYHVVPPLVAPGAEAAFLQGVDDAFGGPVMLARDGLLVSLPAGSEGIEQDDRL